MKRVQAACIIQTLHFLLKENVEHDRAVEMVKEEVKRYKEGLDKKGIKYRILSETMEEDGTILMEIKKQYNTSPVGTYLD